ncbi:unnamed protein product, partial [Cyprideis torosa]
EKTCVPRNPFSGICQCLLLEKTSHGVQSPFLVKSLPSIPAFVSSKHESPTLLAPLCAGAVLDW